MKWVKNLSIAFKVAAAPTLALLGLVVVGAAGYLANSGLDSTLREVGLTRVPQIIESKSLAQRLTAIHAAVNQSLAWEGAGFKAVSIDALDKQILVLMGSFSADLNKASQHAGLTGPQERLLKKINEDFEKYSTNARQALEIKSGMVANAASYMTTMDESFSSCMTSLDELVEAMAKEASIAVDNGAKLASRNQIAIVSVFLLSSLVTLAIAQGMKNLLVEPIVRAAGLARSIAEGDLSQNVVVDLKDETGALLSALSDMQTKLVGIVDNVRRNSEGVAVASAEIAQGNQDLSDRTEAQASALQETAASMEQLSATVAQNAENARHASLLARDTSTVAAQGGEVVARVVSTMKGINDSSGRIADIIGVIDGIAFQTNILALNAAVEAARAGEQGRGFAVVASEVRALAGRSANAAREIKDLISASVQQVEQGSSLVDQAGETMQDVVASIRKLNDIVGEISAASAEQSAGVKEVSEAVTSMDQTTQQNAALVEEMTAAASSLKSQADDLVDAVAVFKIGVQVNHATKAPTTRVSKLSVSKPSQSRIPASQIATKTRPDDRSVRSSNSEKMVVSRSNISVADDGWESY